MKASDVILAKKLLNAARELVAVPTSDEVTSDGFSVPGALGTTKVTQTKSKLKNRGKNPDFEEFHSWDQVSKALGKDLSVLTDELETEKNSILYKISRWMKAWDLTGSNAGAKRLFKQTALDPFINECMNGLFKKANNFTASYTASFDPKTYVVIGNEFGSTSGNFAGKEAGLVLDKSILKDEIFKALKDVYVTLAAKYNPANASITVWYACTYGNINVEPFKKYETADSKNVVFSDSDTFSMSSFEGANTSWSNKDDRGAIAKSFLGFLANEFVNETGWKIGGTFFFRVMRAKLALVVKEVVESLSDDPSNFKIPSLGKGKDKALPPGVDYGDGVDDVELDFDEN